MAGDVVILGMRWLDIATLAAIVLGPILAVAVDRIQSRWTDSKRRRLETFRDLMRTRRARLDPVHVGALNLVDLEFYGREKVIGAYSAYIEHLSTPLPMPDAQERFFEKREELLVKLLYEMGQDLGYEFDKRDLETMAYGPTGWNNDQNLHRQNMTLLNEMLSGRRSLPVSSMQPPQQNPFPPAPVTPQPPAIPPQ